MAISERLSVYPSAFCEHLTRATCSFCLVLPSAEIQRTLSCVWMSVFDPVQFFSNGSMESLGDPVMKCFVLSLENSKHSKDPGDGGWEGR